MKITKERFQKLPQLDRIEFRQREDRIEESFKVGYLFSMIRMWFFIIAFILLLYVGLLNISAEIAIKFMNNIAPQFIFLIKLTAVIGFAVDVLSIILRIKYKKQLINDFFGEDKVKKKKK